MRAAVRQQLDPSIRSNDTRDFHQSLRAKIVGQEEGVQASWTSSRSSTLALTPRVALSAIFSSLDPPAPAKRA